MFSCPNSKFLLELLGVGAIFRVYSEYPVESKVRVPFFEKKIPCNKNTLLQDVPWKYSDKIKGPFTGYYPVGRNL